MSLQRLFTKKIWYVQLDNSLVSVDKIRQMIEQKVPGEIPVTYIANLYNPALTITYYRGSQEIMKICESTYVLLIEDSPRLVVMNKIDFEQLQDINLEPYLDDGYIGYLKEFLKYWEAQDTGKDINFFKRSAPGSPLAHFSLPKILFESEILEKFLDLQDKFEYSEP